MIRCFEQENESWEVFALWLTLAMDKASKADEGLAFEVKLGFVVVIDGCPRACSPYLALVNVQLDYSSFLAWLTP